MSQLKIHQARYGVREHGQWVDVQPVIESLAKDGSLDIVIDNSTLTPQQNLYRGKKKSLWMTYSIDGGEQVEITRQEKEWLIIGPAAVKEIDIDGLKFVPHEPSKPKPKLPNIEDLIPGRFPQQPMTAAALNDFLIRRFHISDRRLRTPMPVELRDFNRNDLAKLFAELGFTKGAEIGVAEGHFSEVLCQSIPNLELLCVDPWTRYSGNPWAHSQEHQNFSKSETERKLKGYNAKLIQDYSMNAVRDVPENSLDFAYVDGHHGFDWVMQDLIEWGKRVRSGGCISGDDYYHFKRHWGGVVEAVNAYVGAHKIPLWFLIDAPQSVDFFWVKP